MNEIAPDGAQPIRISEVRERVVDGDGGLLATLSGAEVVRLAASLSRLP